VYYKFWVLVILFFAAASSVKSAQESLPEPIFLEGFMVSEFWTLDSEVFVFKTDFEERGVLTNQPSWFEFHTDTGEVIRSRVWRLNPALSPEDYETYGILTALSGEPSFIYASPNRQFLVYGHVSTDGDGNHPLAVVDLSTGQYLVTDIITYGTFPASFALKWSDDSSAFTVKTVSPYTAINTYHVTNFQEDIQLLSYSILRHTLAQGVTYVVFDIFDISADGDQILLLAATERTNRKLIVWSPQTPTEAHFINVETTNLLDAAFHPDIANNVMMINEAGIVLYDYLSDKTQILQSAVNTMWIQQARFSPNAHWVAVAEYHPNDRGDLYMVEVIPSP
jgi:hypothetical protein